MNTQRIATEPVAFASVVRSLLAVAVAFGIGLSGEQVAAVVVAVEVISAWWTRSQVTPIGRDHGGEPAA